MLDNIAENKADICIISEANHDSKISDTSKKFEASLNKPTVKPVAKKVTRKIIKKKTTDDAVLKMFESINSKMDTNNAQMFSLN